MLQTIRQKLLHSSDVFYSRLGKLTGGHIAIPVEAARRFNQTTAPVAASSLAFYAIFSLFPLLGVLVALVSFVVPLNRVHSLLLETIVTLFPVSVNLITDNIDRFIQLRGTISLVGTLGLLWSASSGVTILLRHIDLAWEKARVRSSMQRRLIALGVILAVILITSLLGFITGLADFLTRLNIPIVANLVTSFPLIWQVVARAASPVLSFVVFYVLYRWAPRTRVKASEAGWGALVVAIAWTITGVLFNWYVGSGLASYDLLYGSLAALAVLMLWFYLNSLILLFGAHLCASIARWREKKGVFQAPQETSMTSGHLS